MVIIFNNNNAVKLCKSYLSLNLSIQLRENNQI